MNDKPELENTRRLHPKLHHVHRWPHWLCRMLRYTYQMFIKFLLPFFFLLTLAVGFLFFLECLARETLLSPEPPRLMQAGLWVVGLALLLLNMLVFPIKFKKQRPEMQDGNGTQQQEERDVPPKTDRKTRWIRHRLHSLLRKLAVASSPEQTESPKSPHPDTPTEVTQAAQPSVEDQPSDKRGQPHGSDKDLPGSEPPPVVNSSFESPSKFRETPTGSVLSTKYPTRNSSLTVESLAESVEPPILGVPYELDNPVVPHQIEAELSTNKDSVIELGEQTARRLGEFLDLHESDPAAKVQYYMRVDDDNTEGEVAVDKAIEVAIARLTHIWETMLRSYQQEIHAALREHQLKTALDKLEQCKTMLPGFLDERVRTRFPTNLAQSIEELQQEVDVERSEYEKANRLLQQMRNHKDPVKQYELWQQANNSYPYHSGIDEAQRTIESHCRERVKEIIEKIEKIVQKSETGDDKTQARNVEQICYLLEHMKRLLGFFADLEIEYGFHYSTWHKKYCTQVT